MTSLELNPGLLTLADLQALHAGGLTLTLNPSAHAPIAASAAVVQAAAAGDAPVYGVNTGFGKLANKRISQGELEALQRNLIRSHSVGVGAPLQPAVVRLMLALKAASRSRAATRACARWWSTRSWPSTTRAWCLTCRRKARWARRATSRRCRT
jgi:histidine ammonia-lyase